MTARSIGYLSDEQRRTAVNDLIAYFLDERGEEIGIIAAEDVLERFLQVTAPMVYNKAVDDVRKAVAAHQESLDVEIDALKRQ